jgi:transcriptional regulator with XRE-family HTH domain
MPRSRPTDDILVRFGERLRTLRKAAGLSQERFALDCNLDRSYVGAIERGERNVSLRYVDRFAKALGVTMSEIVSGL